MENQPIEEIVTQPEPQPVNPLLARVEMPGSTFQLPSRGLFYDHDELDSGVAMGEVHVHPMSAFDEILMKSPDHLFSGEAIEKVFKRCIPQIMKPLDLLSKDVDFLLVCLRQVTFGDELDITYRHNCKDANNNHYTVRLSEFINSTKKIDPTNIGSSYTVKLNNGQVVKLHPSKFKDILEMYQSSETGSLTVEQELEMAVLVVSSVISSVDDVTNPTHIREWIKTIPAGWISTLSEKIEAASDFGTDFTFQTKCKDCDKDIEIQTPVNPISFFM